MLALMKAMDWSISVLTICQMFVNDVSWLIMVGKVVFCVTFKADCSRSMWISPCLFFIWLRSSIRSLKNQVSNIPGNNAPANSTPSAIVAATSPESTIVPAVYINLLHTPDFIFCTAELLLTIIPEFNNTLHIILAVLYIEKNASGMYMHYYSVIMMKRSQTWARCLMIYARFIFDKLKPVEALGGCRDDGV